MTGKRKNQTTVRQFTVTITLAKSRKIKKLEDVMLFGEDVEKGTLHELVGTAIPKTTLFRVFTSKKFSERHRGKGAHAAWW